MAPDPYRGSVVASPVEVLHASQAAVGDPDQPVANAYPAHIAELARPLAPGRRGSRESRP